MNRIISKITAVLVLIFISFFSVITIFKSLNKETSLLSDSSSLYSGEFTEQLGSFFTENFAGRNRWISVKARLGSEISESIVNGVYVDDNMLLDARISDRHIPASNAKAVSEYAANYSGTVYFTAVPTSSGVYDDLLPEYLLSYPESRQINDFYESLDGSIRTIDAYNILKMLKDNYIYYRNDTKWTGYGAYCVYRTVIQKLGFLPTPYDKYTIEHVTDSFRGDLYEKTLYSKAKADILDVYEYSAGAEITECIYTDNSGKTRKNTLYDRSRLDSGSMYDMYLGEDAPLVSIKTSVNNERRLLVIKDSYGDCFVQFLTQHYSAIDVVSPQYMDGSLADFVDPESYDQTLFVFGIDGICSDDVFSKL